MRTVFLVLVAAGISVTVDRMVIRPAAHADADGGVDGPDMSCADLNDDGETDLTDAVHLLLHLYSGGPAPVCPKGGPLPDTGQTTCYDLLGNLIDCTSDTCAGQDGLYQTGCPSVGRFVDNGDGTVTDTCTGLMWQKETAPGIYTWSEALRYCESLQLGGHSDWRLPNVRELHSLVDYGRRDPSIDPVFDAVPGWYWSSTTDAPYSEHAWDVHFHSGDVENGYGKAYGFYVRAVRSGP